MTDYETQMLQLISEFQQTDAPRIETIYAGMHAVMDALGRYIANEKEFQEQARKVMTQ